MLENRRYKRVATKLRCWCEGQNVTVFARVVNISEGGLFLKTSTPLALGSRALIRLSASEAVTDTGIEAEVTVVWCASGDDGRAPGMGLKFERIDEQRLEQIRNMVAEESSRSRPR